ncbi:hypothetical protein [Symbiopectobacterium sp. RP]|uniref:hypothetical protein n=1 Tax=Symbiopectobacterium sp. RP TaxID=3248553 RepID=UPI003D290852
MTSIFYQNWLEKQHDSLLFNKVPIEHKWAQAKKERVVAIQRFCSQSIWCNQN